MITPHSSTTPLLASIFVGEKLLADGEVMHYGEAKDSSFFPRADLILESPVAQATLIVHEPSNEKFSIVNLRQCEHSRTHWDFRISGKLKAQ